MATATGNRRGASSRQSKAAGRSKHRRNRAYIDDPSDIRTIANALRKAEKAAEPFVESGEIESIRDYADFVEQYSKKKCDRPILMNLIEEGQDYVGCNFAFQDSPKVTTTSAYMMEHSPKLAQQLEDQGVDEPESYFTISSIEDRLGIAPEVDYEDEDSFSDEFELDEEPEPSKSSKQTSKAKQEKRSSNRTKSSDRDDEDLDDDILDLLDESVHTSLPSVPSAKKTQKEQKPSHRLNRASEDIKHTVERIAQNGQTLDGTNLIGGAGQVAHTTITTGLEVAEQLRERDERRRIHALEQELLEKTEQLEDLASRTVSLQGFTQQPSSQQRNQRIAELEAELQAEQEAKLAEEATPDSLSATTNRMIGGINRIGASLDPTIKPLPLVQFDPTATNSDRLDRLEQCVQQIGDRIDRLEGIITRLEKQYAAQKQSSQAEPSARSRSDVALTPTPEASTDGKTAIEQMIAARQTEQQGFVCASALVNFANAHPDHAETGIPLGSDHTLTVQQDLENNNDLKVFVTHNSSSQVRFLAMQKNGEWWKHRDNFNADEREAVLLLPQTKEAYEEKASGQALLMALQASPQFQQAIQAHESFPIDFGAYQLKIQKDLETNEHDVIGVDQANHAVFEARLIPGKSPDVRTNRIPAQDLETMIEAVEPKQAVSHANSARAPDSVTDLLPKPTRSQQSEL